MRKLVLRICVLFATVLVAVSPCYSQQTLIKVQDWNAYVHLPSDYDANPGKSYPTILFTPGTGEIGTDPNKLISNGPGAYIKQGWNGVTSDVQFIVISLQPPSAYPRPWTIKERVDELRKEYRIGDFYLTGLSMGGWASLFYAYTYPSEVKALVGVESVVRVEGDEKLEKSYQDTYKSFAQSGGKMLLFEQEHDYRRNQMVVDAMNYWKPGSAWYEYTSFNGGGHCCWNEFYGGGGKQPGKFNIDGKSQNLYEWIASNVKASGNQAPVADAGSDQTRLANALATSTSASLKCSRESVATKVAAPIVLPSSVIGAMITELKPISSIKSSSSLFLADASRNSRVISG